MEDKDRVLPEEEATREAERRPVVRAERRVGHVNSDGYGPHNRWYEQTWWANSLTPDN